VSRYNTGSIHPPTASPVLTAATVPDARTFEGGPGYTRDAKSELYLLSVSAMIGQARFYERRDQQPQRATRPAAGRQRPQPAPAAGKAPPTSIPWRQETSSEKRFRELVRAIAVDENDLDWLTGFAGWLRRDAYMRTASVVLAAETIHARHTARLRPAGRVIVNAALDRADEPGELWGYWTSRYGRRVPVALKRGLADAIERLYTEYAVLKYDSADKPVRFADLIELCNPRYARHLHGTWRDALYRYCIERRHHRGNLIPARLKTIRAHADLMALPPATRRNFLTDPYAPVRLRDAGVTHEALSGWLGGPVDAAAWSAIIPNMGVGALLKNLRNFDQARVPDSIAEIVTAAISDPDRICGAKVLPMRFLAAQRAMITQRWGHALDKGLSASVANIPHLPGRTLILVDTSTSMDSPFSDDGTMRRWDAAALFGIATAQRCEYADVVSFSSTARYRGDPHGPNTKLFPRTEGESLLTALGRWKTGGWFLQGGTDTSGAVRRHYRDGFHTRVIIVTDEQAAQDGPEVSRCVSPVTPLYTWNLAGYQHGHTPSGNWNRHTFGGLSDASFGLIRLLESGRDARWDDLFAATRPRGRRTLLAASPPSAVRTMVLED